MRIRNALPVLALVAVLAGCASQGIASTAEVPKTASTLRVIDDYDLYTHCGIREARIGNDFYVATPQLNDGSGNPPAGWGNPAQAGTMTVYDDGTARFTAGSRVATFALRKNASDWLGPICS